MVFTKYAIFIIEYEDFIVEIRGDILDNYWDANFLNGENYSILNPIPQLNSNIEFLSNILEIPACYFIPLVLFKTGSRLLLTDFKRTNTRVVTTSKFSSLILNNIEKNLSSLELISFNKLQDSYE